MPLPFIGIRAGYGTEQTATPRLVFRDGQITGYRSGGLTISGGCSRDPGNVGAINDLRAGLVMGRISTVVNSLGVVGQYAPSIIGGITGAVAFGATSITVSSAIATEMVRRFGASGSFHLAGPAVANSNVIEEDVTYSAINTGTGVITCTALASAHVTGSFVMPLDGSEIIRSFLVGPWPFNVFDSDGITAIDKYWNYPPVAASITVGQLLPVVPTDTGLLAWFKANVALGSGGMIAILDTEF